MESGRITGLRREELDLSATLQSGQVFRWTLDRDCVWNGVIEGNRSVRLSQGTDASLYWEADGGDVNVSSTHGTAEESIRRFLRLGEVALADSAETWNRDPLFVQAWKRQPGIRVLRQEPEECFFSFLCASVAPIPRIAQMLRTVATHLGKPLGSKWHTAFPTAAILAETDEQRLRDMGMGFRAKRIAGAARTLDTMPTNWLRSLRSFSPEAARRELTTFFGVGAKIADCVSLFALDKDGAIPVDTHIWRIACHHYTPHLAGKSLTPANYASVTTAFHDRFGVQAGWAQQTLFYRAAVGRDKKQEPPRTKSR